jgi:hypothetical protein
MRWWIRRRHAAGVAAKNGSVSWGCGLRVLEYKYTGSSTLVDTNNIQPILKSSLEPATVSQHGFPAKDRSFLPLSFVRLCRSSAKSSMGRTVCQNSRQKVLHLFLSQKEYQRGSSRLCHPKCSEDGSSQEKHMGYNDRRGSG